MTKRRKRPGRKAIAITSAPLDAVPVVGSWLEAHPTVAYGKLVPVLSLDIRARPDIDELITAHIDGPMFDVDVQWAERPGQPFSAVVLLLRFRRPVDCAITLDLPTFNQIGLIDQILMAGALHLKRAEAPQKGILVMLPEAQFKHEWTERLINQRCEAGRMSRQQAIAEITAWREARDLRLPPNEGFDPPPPDAE